jgi:hypothetical protein
MTPLRWDDIRRAPEPHLPSPRTARFWLQLYALGAVAPARGFTAATSSGDLQALALAIAALACSGLTGWRFVRLIQGLTHHST